MRKMELMTQEEIIMSIKMAQAEIARNDEKQERRKRVAHVIKSILYPPISIALIVTSFVAKIVGILFAIPMPYGFYHAYGVFLKLRSGIALGDIIERYIVFGFVIFPFIAFFVHIMILNLSNYLNDTK